MQRFGFQLLLLIVARLGVNTGLRMMYPFLPAFARGLQIPLEQLADLVALRAIIGVFSPVFGPLSERYGRRAIIVGSLWLFGASCLLVPWQPTYGFFVAMFLLTGIAKILYDPVVYAYIGDVVPYHQRGRVAGIIETSWAGAMVVGAPVVGLLISRRGWSEPFLWLGVMTMVAGTLLYWSLPPSSTPTTAVARQWRLRQVIGQHRVVRASLVYVFCFAAANSAIYINYGNWLETSFADELTTFGARLFGQRAGVLGGLGIITAVIGVAELTAEGLVALIADRFGKRRLVLLFAGGTTLSYFALLIVNQQFLATLIVLFCLALSFEIGFVAGLPLYSQVVPQARGVVLAIVVGGLNLGFAMGSWLGTRIWAWNGMIGIAVFAGVLALMATVLFYYFIPETDVS